MPGKHVADTTKTRVPVCLCLDVSGSVSKYMDTLNAHVRNIYDSIQRLSSGSVAFDMASFKFGGMFSSKRHDVVMEEFSELEEGDAPEILQADEYTPMGKAVKNAYQLLEKYKKTIRDSNMHYFQPVFIIISDGRENSTDQDREWLSTYQKKIRDEASDEKMVAISIGIGSVDEKVMKGFLPKGQEYISGTDINFDEFIRLLVSTVVAKAKSIPQSKVEEYMRGMNRAGRKNLK